MLSILFLIFCFAAGDPVTIGRVLIQTLSLDYLLQDRRLWTEDQQMPALESVNWFIGD